MRDVDRRRYGVIETRFRSVDGLQMYDLKINGELWACIEWSARRRTWCIQDGSGRCLAHCDAIHGTDIDAETAVRLAKRMIIDGRMPTPEDARAQLQERLEADAPRGKLEHDQSSEPWQLLPDPANIGHAR
jgi:hypothetical protein